MTPNFQRLFALIEENTDLYIHLGSYSKNLYEKKYPKAQHKIVNHPLYQNSFEPYKKTDSEKVIKDFPKRFCRNGSRENQEQKRAKIGA